MDYEIVYLNPPPYVDVAVENTYLHPWRAARANLSTLSSCSVLVAYRDFIGPDILTRLPQLRAVIRIGVGFDNLDMPALRERRASAYRIEDYCVSEVAEHSLAMALAIERGLLGQSALIRSGSWSILGEPSTPLPRRISDLSAGIIGFGRIGRALATRLRPLYRELSAYDPFVSDDLLSAYQASPTSSPEALFAKADHVYLHAALTDSSRHIVKAASLQHARAGAVVVNCARGGLVCAEALERALDEGLLLGAGIDTFTPENPWEGLATTRLVAHPRVLSTCHRAFLSSASIASVKKRVRALAVAILEGKLPDEGRVA